MPSDRYISLTSREAALGDKLRAIVRVMKPQPPEGAQLVFQSVQGECVWKGWPNCHKEARHIIGQPGDVLHGRETWAEDWEHGRIFYKADCDGDATHAIYLDNGAGGFGGGVMHAKVDWRSPVTMPRWAIRRHYRVITSRACMAKDLSEREARLLADYTQDLSKVVDDNGESVNWAELIIAAAMLVCKLKPTDWIFYAEVETLNA